MTTSLVKRTTDRSLITKPSASLSGMEWNLHARAAPMHWMHYGSVKSTNESSVALLSCSLSMSAIVCSTFSDEFSFTEANVVFHAISVSQHFVSLLALSVLT